MEQLNNPLLIRFWFRTKNHFGIGVTAYSIADAEQLIEKADLRIEYEILEVVENIDIRTLNQDHIIPNMGAPNFRGVWFPNIGKIE